MDGDKGLTTLVGGVKVLRTQLTGGAFLKPLRGQEILLSMSLRLKLTNGKLLTNNGKLLTEIGTSHSLNVNGIK